MEKIDQILDSLYDRVIEPIEAKEQLLDLFTVIKSVCDECTAYPFDERGKTPLCKTCKDNPSQMLDEVINNKVNQLLSLSDEFIFPAYYSHTGKMMWKISNVYTKYGSETLVLCEVNEGIETAIDLAIELISKAKAKFYGYLYIFGC